MKEDQNSHTFSREEMRMLARERIAEITKEFTEGFKFLEDYPKSVTFFGSSLMNQDNPYCVSARELSGRIAKELGYSVFTGGGPGIMEAANRGAFESGGTSLALTIKLPDPQTINKYITKEVDPYYFFVRKVCLSFSAEAFVFYPGGLGTLDEFFEIMTLIQTRKIVGVPLICVGSDYWKSLERFMQSELLSRGTILPEDLLLYHITDNHDEIIDLIRKSPVRESIPLHLDAEIPTEGGAPHAETV
ncbi:TIGR00730 family Rossman fold protein [Candidatus Parcubacteria bacterium]|nr:TIGR00730 family Rossman fold protein [Candidatus Parcubacteria bacterium]